MGISLTPEERFEVFGDDDPSRYDAEVQERWGETDAYRESRRRTSSYTKDDWLRIKEEGAEVERRFAEALRSGAAADSEQAMDVAEEHRQHISRWFYDCPPEMHAGLGRMYVEDERFTAHYEEIAPGLAEYVSTAVQANAARR
nr:TipAS antibiotic-recognition domain-containing protein [Petropleomorpha daqingensis]